MGRVEADANVRAEARSMMERKRMVGRFCGGTLVRVRMMSRESDGRERLGGKRDSRGTGRGRSSGWW